MVEIASAIEYQREMLRDLQRMKDNFEVKSVADKTRGYVQGLLEEIETNLKQFKDNHVQLYDTIVNKSMKVDDVPYLKEEVYHTYCDLFLTFKGNLLDSQQTSNSTGSPPFNSTTFGASSNASNDNITSNARLPKIDIPHFSGDYLAWISYRDMFTSLVHSNTALSNIQKFYFLKGSCSGTPLDIVNEYPSSDTSYQLAWKALNLRYHNKRKIVDTLLNKLFSIPNSNGSAASIQLILDTTRNCLALLRTLEINPDSWDAILIYMTVNKLDIQTRKEWEQSLKASTEVPSMKELLSFLESAFRTLETIHEQNKNTSSSSSMGARPKVNNATRTPFRRNVHLTTAAAADVNCPCCEKRHLLYKCFKFASLPAAAKRNLITSKAICRNCLRTGHPSKDCKIISRCQICQQQHHTIIHSEFSSLPPNSATKAQTATSESPSHTSTPESSSAANLACNFGTLSMPQVLLATIRVLVKTPAGDFFLRALLDQGAQATIITEDAVQTLQLQKMNTFAIINGVGGKATCTTRNYVSLSLASLKETDFQLQCNALVLPSLTSYQPSPISKTSLPDLKQYSLADPNFYESSSIDLLLGGDIYGDIVLPQHKKFGKGIFLQLTHFGWVVSGPTSEISYGICNVNVNVCSLDDQLRAFWEQEEFFEERQPNQEEAACENYFKNTCTRDSSGRYTVALPFKSKLNDLSLPSFGLTDYSALRRLKQIEASFKVKPELGEAYRSFMNEYEQLGHMRKVSVYPKDLEKNGYFLPHHGVLRESSTTTKLRVVFDGSSKRPNQNSLNEELSAGPALQNDLATIITRWRRYKIGFHSDLEKMFRQIRVIDDHQKYQQILWRDSVDNEIYIYKLCTVTYGTTSAPYLSIRVLQQLAHDERKAYPTACSVLRSDTYVDDVISGADTISEAINLQQQLCKLLEAGGFHLRKWTTNSMELLKRIPKEDREVSTKFALNDQNFQNIVKALGLEWNTKNDTFSFKVNFDSSRAVTKCTLLSDAAKLYDPLGWLSPTTIQAKIMFQKLWLLGLDWKDSLPENLCKEWIDYRNDLKVLEAIEIPRWVGIDKVKLLEIHGFCDASQSAFAAVVYVKVLDSEGRGSVNLLQSKTKVAPLKTVTVPRLELCGANLLVKLIQKVAPQLDREISRVLYWTDSTTVLSWIRRQSSKWSVYVGNRVAEIQKYSNANQWRYVSTRDNPADCASRGISSKDLLNHHLWWTGPQWLSQQPETWPVHPNVNFKTTLEIRKSQLDVLTITTCEIKYPDLLTKYSSLIKVVRITSYILRFIYNASLQLRNKQQNCNNEKITGHLQTRELSHALRTLIKISQAIDFQEEIANLLKRNPVNGKSNISQLCPFLDTNGVLRVGGRLQNSNFEYSIKHPILLKKQNPLSSLIFTDAHIKTLHGGLQLMQSYVSREYWILSSRNLAKSIQRRCVTCFKYNARASQQIMGNLPSIRLQPARPFKHSGVDYAGPITIKQSTARNSVTTKGYICLFVCMVAKALHLEAVTNLSSEAFLAAFKRFTSRRGICTDLYSDCGTNFIGASTKLQLLTNRSKSSQPLELAEALSNSGTTWHFIPPASPNFGGLWEAGVKSTKHHLRRIMLDRILTYEELSTLLSEIEGCLNSRPLCPLSTDPSDCNALTPSHFLIGEPILSVPEESLLDVNINSLSRWKLIEKLKQQFWRRWVNECLCRMQARPKWLKMRKNAEVGDLVLIFDERCPPGQWPLARIQQTHPGSDGLVRVVTLFSKGKTFKRPVSKIALLPINEPSHDVIFESDHQAAVNRGTAKSTRRLNLSAFNESSQDNAS